MKVLKNSEVNSILFIKENIDVSDSTVARFRQFGGTKNIDVPISTTVDDCFTVIYELALGFNALKNGLHTIEILDSLDSLILKSSCLVSGNTSASAYTIDDEEITEDYVYIPPAITFSDGRITFSNNYNG